MKARSAGLVRTEGDLLPADVLQRILNADKKLPGLCPEDYHLASSERIGEAVNRSWQRMLALWKRFEEARGGDLRPSEAGTGQTRQNLLLPLFDELGYGRLQPATTAQRTVGEETYPVSHMWGSSPIHLVGCNVNMDVRTRGVAGAAQASPHSMVQEFLNRSDDHLWGFVSNGLLLRILRDSACLSRQAYIEFDLASIFAGESFSDFALLWLLCHQSRVELRSTEEDSSPAPEGCFLEQWTKFAQESAVEALDKLSGKVSSAIKILGQGFLECNRDTLGKIGSRFSELSSQEYFHQLLRLVYRFIFCFVAEDRNLLHAPGTAEAVRERYANYYSFKRLRKLAATVPGTRHEDAYEGLKLVMKMFGSEHGCASLGISPMGGFLWSDKAVPDLADASLSNECLFKAIRELAFFTSGDALGLKKRPVDYEHLGTRELGSVYEALLAYHPEKTENGFDLRSAAGNDKKKTGSYYTPQQLISSLIESALAPVVREARRSDNPEAALLSLKVCDPACGSGHFLVAAAHHIATSLANFRSGDADPSPAAVQSALRDVIERCIYGVDINPMSVELCRLSLWMESMEPGKPLSFLDHHVTCGNSLLGTPPELIGKGLPDEAFAVLDDSDDRKRVLSLKKSNKAERSRREHSLLADSYREAVQGICSLTKPIDFDSMPSNTLSQISAKEAAYVEYRESDEYLSRKTLADMWCTAFVMKHGANSPVITQSTILDYARTKHLQESLSKIIEATADKYHLFHWSIAFPEVAAKGGFDVVLGNPPWERIKIQEKEWFAARVPEIADALNAATRKRMISDLKGKDPLLYNAFLEDLRISAGASHFIRNSGRYPLCGRGDINMYAVFAESMRTALNNHGRMGIIVPSGIATDDTTKLFFQSMVETKSLVSLFDFENRAKIFPAIDSRIKFCLLTAGNGKSTLARKADFVFFAHSTEELRDPEKWFSLSPEDIARMNPNTLTCPIFRTRRDAELTRAVYRRVPVLIKEERRDERGNVVTENENPWDIRFCRMFDMSNDSNLFRTREQLEQAGGELKGNKFFVEKTDLVQTETGRLEVHEGTWLPLYEAKMIHHYNHRWATYKESDVRDVKPEELESIEFEPMPRYWVHEAEIQGKLEQIGWTHQWLMGWRDITNNTNERTVIGSLFPTTAVGHNLPIWCATSPYLNPTTCCFVCDFFARTKVGGTHLTFFIAEQLAVLSPRQLKKLLDFLGGSPATCFIRPRILELVYSSWDMKPFAEDLGYDGDPFPWDENRRFKLRAELDALFFHLYLPANPDGTWKKAEEETDDEYKALTGAFPTPRSAVDYVMDTFPIVQKKDVAKYGFYRTKDEILRVYDAMQEAMRSGTAYSSPLYQ